jgi:hypothetical protein
MKRVMLALAIVALTTVGSLAATEWFFNPANGDVVEGPVGSPQHYISLGLQANAAAAQAAARGLQRIQGTIQAVQGSTATLKTDDGRMLTLDMTPLATASRVKAGDRTTIVAAPGATPAQWTARHVLDVTPGAGLTSAAPATTVSGAHWFLNPANGDVIQGPVGSPQHYVDLGPQPSAAAAQATAHSLQHVKGTVVPGQGTSLGFRTDDGRTLTLDTTQLAPGLLRDLKAGDRLTVLGLEGRTANQFVTRYALKGDAAPAQSPVPAASGPDWYYNPANGDVVQGPVGSPQAYVNLGPQANAAAAQAAAKAARHIRGQVQAVDTTGIRLKADDGRLLTIDTSRLDPGVRGKLAVGKMVTVYGRYVNDPGNFTASYAHQEDAGAALPRSR